MCVHPKGSRKGTKSKGSPLREKLTESCSPQMLVKYHNKAAGNWEKKKNKPQKAVVFSLTSGKSAFRQSWILILESKSSTLCNDPIWCEIPTRTEQWNTSSAEASSHCRAAGLMKFQAQTIADLPRNPPAWFVFSLAHMGHDKSVWK